MTESPSSEPEQVAGQKSGDIEKSAGVQEPDSKSMSNQLFGSWLFLRIIGIAYFAAFASLGTQVQGLLGVNGILPAARLVHMIKMMEGSSGLWLFPSLYWAHPTDAMLHLICWGGAAASLLVISGVLTAPALIACWILWLSMVIIGQDFLSFQWDILLLEAGFLSIFLAPWRMLEPPWRIKQVAIPMSPPPAVLIWLLYCLLFKLMFESGLVKLTSQDPTWAGLTALDYHYLTQPLPTPAAWLAAKLPEIFLRVSVCGVFVIELLLPFLIFAGRRLRLVAACGFLMLQILIASTGNYAYFNLLTIAMCFLLIDDNTWRRLLPGGIRNWFFNIRLQPSPKPRQFVSVAVACVIGFLTLINFCPPSSVPPLVQLVEAPLSRLFLVNSYGLFASMTTERNEIIVEGSNDGQNWQPYEFRFKPGDLQAPPCIVAPLQPRLDWQMWFAALAPLEHSPWFAHFMVRLFQGSPDVLALLKKNPFPDHPPKFLRAELYRYTFSDWGELLSKGQWWRRQYQGRFAPEISVEQLLPPERPSPNN
jgi:lipase maturation factor 1